MSLPVIAIVLVLTAQAAADVSSDIAKLTRVQQQQASAIQTLQVRVAALESSQAALGNEVSSLTTSMDGLQQNWTGVMDNLQTVNHRADKAVAFSAHMSTEHVLVGHSPFIFNTVVTNVGDAYDPTSGVFTAPYDGLYVFHFVIVNDASAPFMRAALMLEETPTSTVTTTTVRVLAEGTVDGGSNNSYDDASVLSTASLKRGDRVYVQRSRGADIVYGELLCSFSGFMVSP